MNGGGTVGKIRLQRSCFKKIQLKNRNPPLLSFLPCHRKMSNPYFSGLLVQGFKGILHSTGKHLPEPISARGFGELR